MYTHMSLKSVFGGDCQTTLRTGYSCLSRDPHTCFTDLLKIEFWANPANKLKFGVNPFTRKLRFKGTVSRDGG
jgi:hypothetical protein